MGLLPSTPSISRRLLVLIGLAFTLSLVTAGLFKAAVDAALPRSPLVQRLTRVEGAAPSAAAPAGGQAVVYDLGRASRRYLLVVTLVVFLVLRRWVPWRDLTRRGFRDSRRRWAHLGFGAAMALALIAVYLALMAGLGHAVWSPDPPGYMLEKTVEYLLLAVVVALAEETFFRGIVFRAMLTDWGPCRALVVSSTVYAVLHCISGSYWATPGWQPGVGLDLLKAYFTDAAGSLLPDLRLVVGLFLLGALLAYLYLRTGSLWASIGFHSGLVLTSKLMKKMVNRAEGFPSWLLGDYQFLVSGAACWAILVAVIIAVVVFAPRGALYRRLSRLRRKG